MLKGRGRDIEGISNTILFEFLGVRIISQQDTIVQLYFCV